MTFSKVIHDVLLWLGCWDPHCRRTVKRLSEILWARSKTVNCFQWTWRRQKYSRCSFCCCVSAHHQSCLLQSMETEPAVVLGEGYASQSHKLLLLVDPLWQMASTVQLSPFSILTGKGSNYHVHCSQPEFQQTNASMIYTLKRKFPSLWLKSLL